MIARADDVRCIWDARATLGEGPVWCSGDAVLWFVDIKERRIHRFDAQTQRASSWSAPAQPGFIAPSGKHSFIVGLQTGLHRFDPTSGEFTLLREVEPAQSGNRLNDGYVDQRGRLWFGSMDDGETAATGAVYCFDGNAKLTCVDRGICITNGPCVSADGRTFYLTDTVNRTMYAYDLHDDGSLSDKRAFVQFSAAEGFPDGTVVDSEGCLWVGMWGGWAMLRLSPKGDRIGKVSLPCANVTKGVLGGPELKTLYVTTARKGLTDSQLREQSLAGGLFAVDVDVAGLTTASVDLSVIA